MLAIGLGVTPLEELYVLYRRVRTVSRAGLYVAFLRAVQAATG